MKSISVNLPPSISALDFRIMHSTPPILIDYPKWIRVHVSLRREMQVLEAHAPLDQCLSFSTGTAANMPRSIWPGYVPMYRAIRSIS